MGCKLSPKQVVVIRHVTPSAVVSHLQCGAECTFFKPAYDVPFMYSSSGLSTRRDWWCIWFMRTKKKTKTKKEMQRSNQAWSWTPAAN